MKEKKYSYGIYNLPPFPTSPPISGWHQFQSHPFNHGFTTKPTGHGFGLHSAANAATEIGGSLTGASDGPGRGAVFTLTLPLTMAGTIQKAA